MKKEDKRSVIVACAMLLIAVLGNVLLSEIAALLVGIGMSAELASNLLTVAFEGIFLAVPALLFARDSTRRVAPTTGQFLRGIVLGVVGVYVLNMVSVLWALVLERFGISELDGGVTAAGSVNALMGQVLLIGAVPGICEELFFRDYLLGKLEKSGTKKALWLSALFFAMLHASLSGFPAQLLAGLALGYCALATGSVYTSVAMHTTYNSFICILTFMQQDTEAIESVTEYVAETGGISPLLFSLAIYGMVAMFLIRRFAQSRKREENVPSTKLPAVADIFLAVTALALVALTVYELGAF